ncbi:unnamed protein product [Polarella glacialis]|nr:unnamed protein product [Polarella glacialis]
MPLLLRGLVDVELVQSLQLVVGRGLPLPAALTALPALRDLRLAGQGALSLPLAVSSLHASPLEALVLVQIDMADEAPHGSSSFSEVSPGSFGSSRGLKEGGGQGQGHLGLSAIREQLSCQSVRYFEVREVLFADSFWHELLRVLLPVDAFAAPGQLETLILQGTKLPPPALAHLLARGAMLPRLRVLNLDDNAAAFCGRGMLAGAQLPPSLEVLSLRRNRLDARAMVELRDALLSTSHQNKSRSNSTNNNSNNKAPAGQIRRPSATRGAEVGAFGLPRLKMLHLRLNPIGDDGCKALLEVLQQGGMPQLASLDLSGCRISSQFGALWKLIEQPKGPVPDLGMLFLGSQPELRGPLPRVDLIRACYARPSALRQLYLDACPALMAGPKLEQLGQALGACSALTVLSLSYNKLRDKGLSSLCSAGSGLGKCRRLRRLLLRGNHLTEEGAQTLALFQLTSSCLRDLCLRDNELGSLGFTELLRCWPERPPLDLLEVSQNGIDDAGLEALVEKFESGFSDSEPPLLLQALDLAGNALLGEGLAAAVLALGRESRGVRVALKGNSLREEAVQELQALLASDPGLAQVDL